MGIGFDDDWFIGPLIVIRPIDPHCAARTPHRLHGGHHQPVARPNSDRLGLGVGLVGEQSAATTQATDRGFRRSDGAIAREESIG